MKRVTMAVVAAIVVLVGVEEARGQSASATTIAIYSIASPSPVSEPFVLSAVVRSPNGAPTGDVEFFQGAVSLGTGALTLVEAVGSVVSIEVVADHPGERFFTARYLGTGAHGPSESDPLLHIVVPAASE